VGEDFGEMHAPDGHSLSVEETLDLNQAARIVGDEKIGVLAGLGAQA
jgi:hypothetical protein